eukprot:2250778-Karenia_brevis.AAC.1
MSLKRRNRHLIRHFSMTRVHQFAMRALHHPWTIIFRSNRVDKFIPDERNNQDLPNVGDYVIQRVVVGSVAEFER